MATANLCPFCGAYSPRQCELEEETGGECPWELSGDLDEDEDRSAAYSDHMRSQRLQAAE